MHDDVRELFAQHDAFYEVSSYYTVAAARRVHAGFDVDVYAARVDHNAPFMPPRGEYAIGAAALDDVATGAAHDAGGGCTVEAFSFPSSVTFGVRGHAGEPAAMFRIRICVAQFNRPAGAPENDALADVERHLKALGIVRR
jgi:hypothetical protein